MENFAVLVEGHSPSGWIVFAVGRSPEPSVPVSVVAAEIGQKFPDIVGNLLLSAVESKHPNQGVLERVQQCLSWNFQAARPQVLEDEDSIYYVAFKLFSRHIAGADNLIDLSGLAAGQTMHTRRIGEMFEAAVPVPDPEPELFMTA